MSSRETVVTGARHQTLARCWRSTWRWLEGEPPAGLLEDLVARWSERHRHYHDSRHLLECLEEAAASRGAQEAPGLVDLALWFHDAVYDPRRDDNEERSAELAAAALRGRLAARGLTAVGEMILATRHRGASVAGDAAVVADIDLAILGSRPERFAAYGRDVRHEYGWVPEAIYRQGRAAVLRSFLDRPRIYTTAHFRERYEGQARVNLERALASLEPPSK